MSYFYSGRKYCIHIFRKEWSREQGTGSEVIGSSQSQVGNDWPLRSVSQVNFPFLPTHEWDRPVLAGQYFLVLKGVCVGRSDDDEDDNRRVSFDMDWFLCLNYSPVLIIESYNNSRLVVSFYIRYYILHNFISHLKESEYLGLQKQKGFPWPQQKLIKARF